MRKLLKKVACLLRGHRFPVHTVDRTNTLANLNLLMSPDKTVYCGRCEAAATASARIEYKNGVDYLVVKVR